MKPLMKKHYFKSDHQGHGFNVKLIEKPFFKDAYQIFITKNCPTNAQCYHKKTHKKMCEKNVTHLYSKNEIENHIEL